MLDGNRLDEQECNVPEGKIETPFLFWVKLGPKVR